MWGKRYLEGIDGAGIFNMDSYNQGSSNNIMHDSSPRVNGNHQSNSDATTLSSISSQDLKDIAKEIEKKRT
jgi:hypothetical protein